MRRKSISSEQASLPSVGVIEIAEQDKEGMFHAHALYKGQKKKSIDVLIVSTGRTRRIEKGARALARLRQVSKRKYEAKIIRVFEEENHSFLGVVRKKGHDYILIPTDKRERREFLLIGEGAEKIKENSLIRAEKMISRKWEKKKARFIEYIGNIKEKNAFSLIALHEYGWHIDFSPQLLEEAAQAKAKTVKREDKRDIPFITIDPANARDHDDAVWAEEEKDGFTIFVAIADVSAYVAEGSALDKEAKERGNSVYLPDCVIPMLPEHISNILCSLREGEDRPFLGVEIKIDKNGKKKQHRFVRGLMRSHSKLSYEQAEAIIQGKEKTKDKKLEEVLLTLSKAYKCLEKGQKKHPPLNLNIPETEITLDKQGKVKQVSKTKQLATHKLIEMFMIIANICAAETLEKHQRKFIYRVHDKPVREKLTDLAEMLKGFSLRLDLGQPIRPDVFNHIIAKAKGKNIEHLVGELILRCQSQAVYSTRNLGHFGLSLAHYSHFTSPIRRYSDLTCHRGLIAALTLGEDGISAGEEKKLEKIAESLSEKERRAMMIERSSADRYLASFLEHKTGEIMEGRIQGLNRAGIFVELEESYAQGLLPARKLGAEPFYHDEASSCLRGRNTGLCFRLGDRVRVSLDSVQPLSGGIIFGLVEGGKREKKLPRPTRMKHYRKRR